MIQIGDRVSCRVQFTEQQKNGAYEARTLTLPGEVIFIHPAHRFYTVSVRLPNGQSFRTTEYFKT